MGRLVFTHTKSAYKYSLQTLKVGAGGSCHFYNVGPNTPTNINSLKLDLIEQALYIFVSKYGQESTIKVCRVIRAHAVYIFI
jgi:hypothetical protein